MKYKPKEVVLDYATYEEMLEELENWPLRFKQVIEEGTHVLLKSMGVNGPVYALVSKEGFEEHKNKFSEKP